MKQETKVSEKIQKKIKKLLTPRTGCDIVDKVVSENDYDEL